MSEQINKDAVKLAFNSAQASYDENAAMQLEVGSRLLDRLNWVLLQPNTILELGCSNGRFCPKLQEKYPKAAITGLDFADKMIESAQKNYPELNFVCADMHETGLPSNHFDLIYSNLTMQWSEQLPELFAELYRLLTPGGLLLFTTLGPDTLHELKNAFSQIDAYPHVNNFYDMHDVGDAMLSTQFLDPVVDTERLTYLYKSPIQLMKELKKTGTSNQSYNKRQQLMGRHAFNQVLQNYPLTEDKLAPVSYEVIYGHAYKPTKQLSKKQDAQTHTFPIDHLRAMLRGNKDEN